MLKRRSENLNFDGLHFRTRHLAAHGGGVRCKEDQKHGERNGLRAFFDSFEEPVCWWSERQNYLNHTGSWDAWDQRMGNTGTCFGSKGLKK